MPLLIGFLLVLIALIYFQNNDCCVYRKPKPGCSGHEVLPGSRVN